MKSTYFVKLFMMAKSPYAYDANGNLISDGIRKFFYDSQDRLIAIEEREKRIEYAYDPFHRRLWKKVFVQENQVNYDRYLWDGENEIGVVDENGGIQELRILGEGLGAEIGGAVLYEIKGKAYVPIHDIQGSTVTLIDLESKESEECCRYTAYGEELTDSQLSPWRFAGKRAEETGLIFFGRRYYCPELGRWITQDPLGFKGGPNLYAYVHNSPLTEADLYGLLSIGNCLGTMSCMAFKGLEWTGANLIPIPYLRGVVESVGRWGAGGNFCGPSRYCTGGSEIITIPGRNAPHHSFTHGNGMLTSRANAIQQAEYISHTHGDAQVDLLYHGTQGLIMDLIGCGLSKLGMPTSYNKMCANYYQEKLHLDPDHRFTSSVHSRGGIQIMNTGRLLKLEQRQHITVVPFGSATLIPDGYFKSAVNNLSPLDVVAMTNPLAYAMGLLNKQYHINFLPPSTYCPLKEHGFLAETYAREIKRRGDAFKELYFNK
jgi:RHS repeat-associated protein